MAEEKKTDAGDAEDAPKKGGLLTRLPVIVGGVMVIEAVALFGGMKLFGGGPDASAAAMHAELEGAEHATAADGHGEADGSHATAGDVMVPLAEVRAHNTKSGRQYVFDVTLYAVADADHAEDVKAKAQAYAPMIQDRARTIIGEADPEKLSGAEPGLQTLRRKMAHELDAIFGEGAIKEVLVPRCVPFRIDF